MISSAFATDIDNMWYRWVDKNKDSLKLELKKIKKILHRIEVQQHRETEYNDSLKCSKDLQHLKKLEKKK